MKNIIFFLVFLIYPSYNSSHLKTMKIKTYIKKIAIYLVLVLSLLNVLSFIEKDSFLSRFSKSSVSSPFLGNFYFDLLSLGPIIRSEDSKEEFLDDFLKEKKYSKLLRKSYISYVKKEIKNPTFKKNNFLCEDKKNKKILVNSAEYNICESQDD